MMGEIWVWVCADDGMGWDGIEQWMGAWVSCRVRSSEMQAL